MVRGVGAQTTLVLGQISPVLPVFASKSRHKGDICFLSDRLLASNQGLTARSGLMVRAVAILLLTGISLRVWRLCLQADAFWRSASPVVNFPQR